MLTSIHLQFPKLCGMTGTAATESAEFESIYKLKVTLVPTNKPMIRKVSSFFLDAFSIYSMQLVAYGMGRIICRGKVEGWIILCISTSSLWTCLYYRIGVFLSLIHI